MTNDFFHTAGFMQRQPGSHHFPASRDYCLPVISCECVECPVNHNSKCSMASAIKINSGGKCQTGADFIELKKFKDNKPAGKTYQDGYIKEGD